MRLPATVLILLVSAVLLGCGGDEPTATSSAPATAPATQNAAGEVQAISVGDAAAQAEAGRALLVDVREDDEWQAGRAPDAVHVPLAQVQERLEDLDERRGSRTLIFICRSGRRSAEAARAAQAAGLAGVFNVDGGMNDWVAAGLPLQPADGSII